MQPNKTLIGTGEEMPFIALYYSVAPTKKDLKEVETAKVTFKKIGVNFKINRWHTEVNVVPTKETEEERTLEDLIRLCRRFLREAGLPQDVKIDQKLTVYEHREWSFADLAEAFSIEALPHAHTHSLVIDLNQEFPSTEVYRIKRLVPEPFRVRIKERQIILWPEEKQNEPVAPLAALQWYRVPLQALGMWQKD